MSFKIADHVPASDVVTNGTMTVAYPTGTDAGAYVGTYAHKAFAEGLQANLSAPGDFTVSFGTSSITVTYKGTTTLPAGKLVKFQFDTAGPNKSGIQTRLGTTKRTAVLTPVLVNLGAPDTADDDSIIASATSTELPNATTTTYTPDTNGTSPTDGVQGVVTKSGVKYWELDNPRNVSLVVTHGSSVVAMTCLVTGLDEYGNTMSELLTITATGTSKTAAGVKAFKWVRSVALTSASDSTANTAKLGFGDVLGLPIALPEKMQVVRESEDGAAPTAGTLVAAVRSAATTTTGDVRGTYDPNSACNGSKSFELLILVDDPTDLGVTQA